MSTKLFRNIFIFSFIIAISSIGGSFAHAMSISSADRHHDGGLVNKPNLTHPVDRFGTPVLPAPKPMDDPYAGIIWKHGDVSWLPQLAKLAGWEEEHLPRLEKYILRESGGCPNRRGGDAVDKYCNITKVVEWNHRSDTGLLQINGLNYDTSRNEYALLCKEMSICTQEPLLDPLTNLRAAKVLYDYWDEHSASGWHPWEPCFWGEEYAKLCEKVDGKKKKNKNNP